MMKQNELQTLYTQIYGSSKQIKADFNDLLALMNQAKQTRKSELLELDQDQVNWVFSQDMVGMTLYVDLFAGNLKQLLDKVDYFKDLGITYLHLMPLLKPRDGENDGGYAVEDYRQIDPQLGSIQDFIAVLDTYRHHGIKICIDYVVNHVAKEHEWAKAALNHDQQKQEYFIMYDTDETPKVFNQTVPEVLPDKCPGNFTYYPEIKKYVFTSFSEFQWDLNFKNPKVFNGMVDNLLYLSNLGVNMIRLDAIPFMWKELNTSCRNLQPIHDLLRMFNLIKEEVCPSLALLGEAIVQPEEIVKYFGQEEKTECEVMYNANLMVDIYHAFASRDVRLLTIDANRFQIPSNGTWMNYVRCHDDIGWGFNEEAIRSFRMDPYAHKQFLIHFYDNKFEGSFSRGEPYQYNPLTQDARTNGTLASLLGLQQAIETKETYKRYEALRRINLAHALILSYRGMPLIYSGDEIATLNDQSYLKDPAKKAEGRWVHRAIFDWKRSEKAKIMGTSEYEIYQSLKQMIAIRKSLPLLDGQTKQSALDMNTHQVYCLIRMDHEESFFALYNFSEFHQKVEVNELRTKVSGTRYTDLIQGRSFDLSQPIIELSPYEVIWCKKD
jgi:amylosucrase